MPPDLTPHDPSPAAAVVPPRRRTVHPIWWIAAIAFLLGLVAMFYALPAIERWRTPATPVTALPVASAPAAVLVAPAPPPLSLDALTQRAVLLDAQLRAIEARMASADVASRAAASNATRAEALMIALAARRELNRGVPLGPLEGQLRARFGAEQPAAVDAVINAARQPVTLESLRFALDTIAPSLMTGTTNEGVWNAIGRELKGLIVLRRESTPSPRPRDRIIRVRRLLDSGQVEAALAEVARMPGVASATGWTDAARRYIGARQALNTLELAALAPPPPPPPPVNPVGALPGG
jgi:hypothetical protein